MRDTIFRQEVIDEQSNRLFGGVLIRPPWQVSFIVYLLLLLFVTATLFLAFGTYHRKERAAGILRPNAGLVKVYPPRSGLIESISVAEGDRVNAGQILFIMGEDRIAAGGQDVSALQKPELEALEQQLLARKEGLPAQRQREESKLRADLSRMLQRIHSMRQQLQVTEQRLELKQGRLKRLERLAKDAAISQDEVDRNRDEILLLDSQWKVDQQNLWTEESKLEELKAQLSNLDLRFASEESQLLGELNQTRQKLLELGLFQNQEIRASIAGRVTSLQAYPGMQVDTNRPILTLLPEGGMMEAHLFIPTRAIGFLAEGQRVLLQYDAFPYQKFGVFHGTIQQVALAALDARDIQDMDLSHINEPLYRVVVDLDRQSISAYGKELLLQGGMTLKAEVILEGRNLLQWLLEPLYRVGG
jgi:membrane fusion protein